MLKNSSLQSVSLKSGGHRLSLQGMAWHAAEGHQAPEGVACAAWPGTPTESRSGDSKQGQDDTERSEVSACNVNELYVYTWSKTRKYFLFLFNQPTL